MARLILFNKPYGVLCQFTDERHGPPRPTLAQFIDLPGIYPPGRLDLDSEGLLVMTDDGRLQARIADPRFKLPKTYLVQVEGEPDEAALFEELAPRLGIAPTLCSDAVSERSAASARGNRCVSVGHRSPVDRSALRALRAVGVEYVSTRSIGFDHIDVDAARSLGLSHAQTLRLVVFPQAIRKVTPALMNDFTSMQKDVGLISVLGAVDAVRAAQINVAETYNFTAYVVAGLLFVLLSWPVIRLTDWYTARAQRREQMGGVV